MKRLVLSLAAIVLLCVGFSAPTWALTIQATLDSFSTRTATVVGIGSGGGFGTFSLVNPPAATGDPLLDDLFADGKFLAMCLEPDETITYRTYDFEIVALRDAPTSSAAGPMGLSGEAWIERILARTSYMSVEDIQSNATMDAQLAFQAALYEAGYEDPSATTFSFTSGAAVVTSAADPVSLAVNTTDANDLAVNTDLISAYGLLNVAQTGSDSRSLYTGQDFMVFTRSERTVPSPAPLALMGLGILGLIGARKLRK